MIGLTSSLGCLSGNVQKSSSSATVGLAWAYAGVVTMLQMVGTEIETAARGGGTTEHDKPDYYSRMIITIRGMSNNVTARHRALLQLNSY